VLLQDDLDTMDDSILFKTKKKSTAVQGKASTATPASKPDSTKIEQTAAKPKGKRHLLQCQILFITDS